MTNISLNILAIFLVDIHVIYTNNKNNGKNVWKLWCNCEM